MLFARRHRLRTGHAAACPDFRLPFVVAAAVLPPLGLAGFGWAAHGGLGGAAPGGLGWAAHAGLARSGHWWLPLVGSMVLGAGTVMGTVGGYAYLVESCGSLAGAALAAVVVARAVLTGGMVLVGWEVYRRLGYAW